jgi:hypothetical protein
MIYEVHVPSTYVGKVAGAEQAVRKKHNTTQPEEPIEVKIDFRKFPSGAGTKRPEQPFAVGNLNNVIDAANERVAQVEATLQEEGDTTPKPNTRRLIVAQESGLKLNLLKLGVFDHTVAVVKDLDTGDTGTGISDGVRFPIRDVIATAMMKGGFREHTVGETFAKRMARRGIEVNKQNPYPAMGHKSRDIFIAQATDLATQQLSARRGQAT